MAVHSRAKPSLLALSRSHARHSAEGILTRGRDHGRSRPRRPRPRTGDDSKHAATPHSGAGHDQEPIQAGAGVVPLQTSSVSLCLAGEGDAGGGRSMGSTTHTYTCARTQKKKYYVDAGKSSTPWTGQAPWERVHRQAESSDQSSIQRNPGACADPQSPSRRTDTICSSC
ncbi:hypothetical protein M433DRAFT_393092 [Acidomyces richmondensis BFW]|nr:MAG: hypothetical protein FE78DRAFT_246282 [Acidomyces sp. 'richmondensis']KYG42761.1 hypothetical protein M433DRAFT_393092 [Acidomyces richmondensis BFW]